MSDQAATAQLFRELHVAGDPLLLPNPWDAGSAKVLAKLGFRALATTSGGHAATLGRFDGHVTLDEALEHAAAIVAATDLPVSCDFEHGFADDPDGVAASVAMAVETGLAGLSIEDWSGGEIYDAGLAAERVAAAVDSAHGGPARLVVTGRCENYLHDNLSFDDTLARLLAYQEAGADVLYAPFMSQADDIRRLVAEVDRPVNVLARPDGPSVSELAALGVARISVGGSFHLATLATLEEAASEFLEGTYGFFAGVARGAAVRDEAFGS
jgi:2-methylisocitrate lyase-like PEP mutase family enzyme